MKGTAGAARRAASAALAVLALGGCASVPPPVGAPAEPGPAARGTVPTPAPAPAAQPSRGAGGGAAMVGAPARLNLTSACTARDEAGYTESIRLQVAEGMVRELQARIEVPRRGTCSFQLADFRQTREAPHVELMSRTGGACTVRMWEQQGRLTVAFSDCHDKCSRGAFEHIWPIQLRAADGACS